MTAAPFDKYISPLIFVLAFSATLPQIAKTIQTRIVGDFSTLSIVLNVLSNEARAWYGFRKGEIGFIGIGVWFSAYWAFLLWISLSSASSQAQNGDGEK
jgi:hypothetical protein